MQRFSIFRPIFAAHQPHRALMLRIHKEGFQILIVSALVFALLFWLLVRNWPVLQWPLLVVFLVLYGLFVQFFRNPVRKIPVFDNRLVYAPCDGKICVIEEVFEPEYFKDKRLQVSIFMSPLNVHVNRNPVGGEVAYAQYHPGTYLVAWHPKSSTENERTSIVYRTPEGTEILMRQIAGAVARRIVYYVKAGDPVIQGADMGFIKFGSRVDLFLPLDADVQVQMDQIVKGNLDQIAHLK